MKNIVITGFEPFGEFTQNSSQDVAYALSGTESRWLDYQIHAFPPDGGIPFDIRGAGNLLNLMFSFNKPDILVMLGQSFNPKQTELVLEQRARNYVDYDKDDLSDNTGYRPKPCKIIEGQEQYTTLLPADLLVKRLHKKNVPASISNDCGSNFCNQNYYLVLHHEYSYRREQQFSSDYNIVIGSQSHEKYLSYLLNRPQPDFKTIFVHLPQYPHQTQGQGGREFSEQCKSVKVLIDEIVRVESDESLGDKLLRYVRGNSFCF